MINKEKMIKLEIALRGLNINLDGIIAEVIYETILQVENGKDIVPEFLLTKHTEIYNRRVVLAQQKIVELLRPLTDKPEMLASKIAAHMMGKEIEDEGNEKKSSKKDKK